MIAKRLSARAADSPLPSGIEHEKRFEKFEKVLDKVLERW